MHVILLNGGLGNQLFQFFYGLALQKRLGELVWFDDSYFDMPVHVARHSNNADAQRRLITKLFGFEVNSISKLFSSTDWNLLLLENVKNNISIPQRLLLNGINITLIAETDDYNFSGKVIKPSLTDSKFDLEGDYYHHGYFITRFFYDQIKSDLNFNFPSLTESHNLFYMKDIADISSVGIHIRKFSKEGFNWDVSSEWYFKAVQLCKKQISNPKFFIFSDDLLWCKENITELGFIKSDVINFVCGNEHQDLNYRDMQLLASCQHLIISNSSFSYLAAIMNNRNGLRLNPTNRTI